MNWQFRDTNALGRRPAQTWALWQPGRRTEDKHAKWAAKRRLLPTCAPHCGGSTWVERNEKVKKCAESCRRSLTGSHLEQIIKKNGSLRGGFNYNTMKLPSTPLRDLPVISWRHSDDLCSVVGLWSRVAVEKGV